jgi:hypothetical protein
LIVPTLNGGRSMPARRAEEDDVMRLDLATLALLALSACAAAGPDTGPPVSAEALCVELAETICEAAASCCEPSRSMTECRDAEQRRCTESLGALVADPRVGYVPERGGALLELAQRRADGCWEEPFQLAELDAIFEGTGANGTDCSPRVVAGAVPSAELHRAAVACVDGSTCRVRLAWDGSPQGTCEARSVAGGDRCSHPYDCETGTFCNLPSGWRVGDWATCTPLRSDGWACGSDFECASGYCGSGVCGERPMLDRCLVVDYPTLVLDEAPIAYHRLDDGAVATASDVSGRGNHASYEGTVTHTEQGALTDDGAIALDGTGGHLVVQSLAGLGADAATIELWVGLPEGGGGGPLLELNGDDAALQLAVSAGRLSARYWVAPEVEGEMGTVVEVATADGAVGAGFHHVALVYDGATTRLFVDAVLAAELVGTQRLPTSPDLVVGSHPDVDPALTTFFSGAIDELAIHARATDAGGLARRVRIVREGPIENDFVLFAWSR